MALKKKPLEGAGDGLDPAVRRSVDDHFVRRFHTARRLTNNAETYRRIAVGFAALASHLHNNADVLELADADENFLATVSPERDLPTSNAPDYLLRSIPGPAGNDARAWYDSLPALSNSEVVPSLRRRALAARKLSISLLSELDRLLPAHATKLPDVAAIELAMLVDDDNRVASVVGISRPLKPKNADKKGDIPRKTVAAVRKDRKREQLKRFKACESRSRKGDPTN